MVKKCNDCNIDMIENITIEGKHPFEVGFDKRVDLHIKVPRKTFPNVKFIDIKSRICPQCGKVELYIDPEELQKQ